MNKYEVDFKDLATFEARTILASRIRHDGEGAKTLWLSVIPALQGEVTSGFMTRSQVMYYVVDSTGHCLDGFDSFLQAIEEFNKL